MPEASPDFSSLQPVRQKKKATLQSQFEKLLRSIERAERDFEATRESLERSVTWFDEHIRPLALEEADLRVEALEKLAELYQLGDLIPKGVRKDLAFCVTQTADLLAARQSRPGPLAKAVLKELAEAELKASAGVRETVQAELRAFLKEMANATGIDVNPDDIEDPTDAEQVDRAFREASARRRAEPPDEATGPEARKERRKTARQEERERLTRETEALKDKSLGTLFRQLAKVLHPDLEPDETLKAERQSLMQELTAAYERRDLSALLRMELRWLQKQEHNIEALGELRAKAYIQLLKDQLATLKDSVDLLLAHPRYQPVLNASQGEAMLVPFGSAGGPVFRKHVQEVIESLKEFIEDLESDQWRQTIRDLTKQLRSQQRRYGLD
jgi:hypothetical protein